MTERLRDPAPRGVLAATLMTVVASLSFSASTTALCSEIETPTRALASGELAFVGVVESVTNLGRWATVHVVEVWSSGDLPEWVEMRGSINGPADPFGIFTTISEGDKNYSPGSRYLFFPTIRDGRLYDFECGASGAWDPSLDSLRPSSAHAPLPGAHPSPEIPWAPLLVGAAVIGGVLAILVIRRARTG